MEVVVDTSALVAVALGERSGSWVFEEFNKTDTRLISSASVVELEIVLTYRLGAAGPAAAQMILSQGAIDEVSFDSDQARLATLGFVKFGKGQHPAGLNLGDCFVYGLARSRQLPVLCMGNDFPQTDLDTIRPD